MRKFALPLGIFYAAYVILNMLLFVIKYHGTAVTQEHSWAYLIPYPSSPSACRRAQPGCCIGAETSYNERVKLFDSSSGRAIEDFRAYASERAIAFSDLEAIDENARRLSILDPVVAGKRFAYIGESDHFIHEKYAYRLLDAEVPR